MYSIAKLSENAHNDARTALSGMQGINRLTSAQCNSVSMSTKILCQHETMICIKGYVANQGDLVLHDKLYVGMIAGSELVK